MDSAKQTVSGASLEVAALDLASLASVHECATSVLQTHERLAWLFNNAGVMALPRHETTDGFELQFETNYLSHFALTGLVLPRLLNTPHSRVVTLTSMAGSYTHGRINFDDLNGKRSYGRWRAYGQSKLANLLFADELQRRLLARTELQATSMTSPGAMSRVLNFVSLPLS